MVQRTSSYVSSGDPMLKLALLIVGAVVSEYNHKSCGISVTMTITVTSIADLNTNHATGDRAFQITKT